LEFVLAFVCWIRRSGKTRMKTKNDSTAATLSFGGARDQGGANTNYALAEVVMLVIKFESQRMKS